MILNFLDPTSRWNVLRGSPELRPYNSLPRGQDINNYPSLALHQTNLKNQQLSVDSHSPIFRRKSPTRRSQSEDVYADRDIIERSSSPYQGNLSPHSVNSAHLSTSPVGSVNLLSSSPSSGEAQPVLSSERLARVNPLIKYAQSSQKERKISPNRRQRGDSEGENVGSDDGTGENKGELFAFSL